MSKILFIIDPQNDFINGTLAVGGAVHAMDELADYVATHAEEYAAIIVTSDAHPADHCSFKPNGGPWPVHCIAKSDGAHIWYPLQQAIDDSHKPVIFLAKGERRDVEEYSVYGAPGALETITRLIESHNVDEADICGIAGDVCVLSTLKDALGAHPNLTFRVLGDYSPSIDGGAALDAFIESNPRVTKV